MPAQQHKIRQKLSQDITWYLQKIEISELQLSTLVHEHLVPIKNDGLDLFHDHEETNLREGEAAYNDVHLHCQGIFSMLNKL